MYIYILLLLMYCIISIYLRSLKHHNIRTLMGYSEEIRENVADSVDLQVPPEANSILGLFGTWLFDAAVNECPQFEMGRAQALGTLSRIFCERTNRRLVMNYYYFHML
jgi:hypothetical protein